MIVSIDHEPNPSQVELRDFQLFSRIALSNRIYLPENKKT